MLAILRYWQPILAALLVAVASWYLHSWRVDALKAKHGEEIKAAVASAVTVERDACAKQQKLTQGVSDAYQKKLAAANARYNNAVRELLTATGNPASPTAGTAERRDAAPGAGRLYYADEAGAIPALERAAIASRQAEQLIACQDFIRAERR